VAYTAQSLLDEVRLRAMLPSATVLGVSDADILLHANSEMASTVVPLVLSCSEEFFVSTIDIPLVSNQTQYRLPDNNIGARVRNVSLVNGGAQSQLVRIEPERLAQYTTNAVGVPLGFYMDGGGLNLLPGPSGSYTLRVRYYARPGQLTNTASNYRTLSSTSYNSTRTMLTFSSGATGTLTPTAGTAYDIIAARSPFDTMIQNTTVSGVGPFTVTGTSNFPQTVQDGDYLCVRDTSPFLQIPVEAQSLLIQLTTCAVLAQLGDTAKLGPALDKAETLKEMAMRLLTPRTDGNPQKMRGLLGGVPGWAGYGVR